MYGGNKWDEMMDPVTWPWICRRIIYNLSRG